MQNKNSNKRQDMFDEFSKNLSIITNNPYVNYYICPLCIGKFTKDDLNQKSENPLTLEDVPPKKLNGKPLLLTCKKCNNINGSIYDSHISKWFKVYTAIEGEGDFDFKMSIDSSNPFKVKFTRDSTIGRIDITSNKKNPYAQKNVSDMHRNGKGKVKYIFDLGDGEKINEGLLRFAYLYAFYYFGYSYIFSPGGTYINEYLSFNKNKELKPLVIPEKLDDLDQGIYAVTTSSNIELFLVILKFGSTITKNAGIIIPKPQDEHLNNFKSIDHEKVDLGNFRLIIKQKINVRPFLSHQV